MVGVYSIGWELDGEAGEVVFRICEQAERAVMCSKDVADEQKAEPLALGLGREEGGEEVCGHG